MYSVWTKHIKDPEEKKIFENTVLASKSVIEQIISIMDGLEKGLDSQDFSLKHYESPSWAPRQAHNNGYRHCLRTLKILLDLDKQETAKDEV